MPLAEARHPYPQVPSGGPSPSPREEAETARILRPREVMRRLSNALISKGGAFQEVKVTQLRQPLPPLALQSDLITLREDSPRTTFRKDEALVVVGKLEKTETGALTINVPGQEKTSHTFLTPPQQEWIQDAIDQVPGGLVSVVVIFQEDNLVDNTIGGVHKIIFYPAIGHLVNKNSIENGIQPQLAEYKQLIRSVHPQREYQEVKPGVEELVSLPLDEKARADLSRARYLFAEMRAQGGLLSDQDAQFLLDSVDMFSVYDKPFHTDSKRREDDVAQIDERYGQGKYFLEAMNFPDARDFLEGIANGAIQGDERMQVTPAPVRQVMEILKQTVGPGAGEYVVGIARNIINERGARLDRASNRQFQVPEEQAIYEVVDSLSDVRGLSATAMLQDIVEKAMRDERRGLRRIGLEAFTKSIRTNIAAIANFSDGLQHYSYLLDGWRKSALKHPGEELDMVNDTMTFLYDKWREANPGAM